VDLIHRVLCLILIDLRGSVVSRRQMMNDRQNLPKGCPPVVESLCAGAFGRFYFAAAPAERGQLLIAATVIKWCSGRSWRWWWWKRAGRFSAVAIAVAAAAVISIISGVSAAAVGISASVVVAASIISSAAEEKQ
jgi:hypothetical protein